MGRNQLDISKEHNGDDSCETFRGNFLALVKELLHFECSNPRDGIFALHNIHDDISHLQYHTPMYPPLPFFGTAFEARDGI